MNVGFTVLSADGQILEMAGYSDLSPSEESAVVAAFRNKWADAGTIAKMSPEEFAAAKSQLEALAAFCTTKA